MAHAHESDPCRGYAPYGFYHIGNNQPAALWPFVSLIQEK